MIKIVAVVALLCVFVGVAEAQGTIHFASPAIIWRNLLWDFHPNNCTLKCTAALKLFCLQNPSREEVCATILNNHFCCHRNFITSSSTTTTTSSTPTTPSSTTSTENPVSQLCGSAEETECSQESGCASSIPTIHSYWKTRLDQRKRGCASTCWEHCLNPCACKTAAGGQCEYEPVTGKCTSREVCQDGMFEANECRRGNSFYSSAGFLCHYNKEEMNCGGGTTLFGVNIGGGMHVDKRNIVYGEDKDTVFQDIYNTKRELEMDIELIVDENDKLLYGSCVTGVANGTDFGQCIKYPIKLEGDGEYEIGVRTVEPQYIGIGKRLFSLTLNDVLLVAHVDLTALTDRRGKPQPIDIMTNFRVETKRVYSNGSTRRRMIIIKGSDAIILPTNRIYIGLCISECKLCEEYSTIDPGYVLAGLSLVKFPLNV